MCNKRERKGGEKRRKEESEIEKEKENRQIEKKENQREMVSGFSFALWDKETDSF